jgi:hypothetical protein
LDIGARSDLVVKVLHQAALLVSGARDDPWAGRAAITLDRKRRASG